MNRVDIQSPVTTYAMLPCYSRITARLPVDLCSISVRLMKNRLLHAPEATKYNFNGGIEIVDHVFLVWVKLRS